MGLVLNDDQQLLADSACGYFKQKAPVSALRALRDQNDPAGFDTDLWQDMATMGYAGVIIPEAYGGVDMGFQAAGLLAEQMGRNLTASPFLSTAILAAQALKSASPAQKSAWLPNIAHGTAIVALALEEGRQHNPVNSAMSAKRSGNGFRLNGHKTMVLDGHVADQLIVLARTSAAPGDRHGLSLFLVDPKTAGISIKRTILIDSRNAAELSFDNVDINADAVLGTMDQGYDILRGVLNAGRAIISAEIYGTAHKAFHITTDYMRERQQFGKPIGTFQALQHRAAHLYTELELARSAMLAALTALDDQSPNAEHIIAMTKAKMGQVAKLAALEGVQLHGGVGMTDEYDIGLYLKRIRAAQTLFGDEHYHMHAIATMKGY